MQKNKVILSITLLLLLSLVAAFNSGSAQEDLCANVTCDDANLCTKDHCDPATGSCVYDPLTCPDSTLTCPDGYVATCSNTCDSATGQCSACTPDCTGHEVVDKCAGVVCDDITKTCPDGYIASCTPICDPETGVCGTCDPDCTGHEVIDKCAGVVCDDDNLCTNDYCDPHIGNCIFDPITCDDGNLCTIDTCNSTIGCVYTPVTCPENQTCDLNTGECITVTHPTPVCPPEPEPMPPELCPDGEITPVIDDKNCIIGYYCKKVKPAFCGNDICEEGENKENCPQDCRMECPETQTCPDGSVAACYLRDNECICDCPTLRCGDGVCQYPEDSSNCPADCAPVGAICGNDICEQGEDQYNCPQDCKRLECPRIEIPQEWFDKCGSVGGRVSKPPPDARGCEVAPICVICGNRMCEPEEDKENCPVDCLQAFCGNQECEPGENPYSCPEDCRMQAICGNNICEPGEKRSCPQDCAEVTPPPGLICHPEIEDIANPTYDPINDVWCCSEFGGKKPGACGPSIPMHQFEEFLDCIARAGLELYYSHKPEWEMRPLPEFAETTKQLELLEPAFEILKKSGRTVNCFDERELCDAKGIEVYPTWIISGVKYEGVQDPDYLQRLTDCYLEMEEIHIGPPFPGAPPGMPPDLPPILLFTDPIGFLTGEAMRHIKYDMPPEALQFVCADPTRFKEEIKRRMTYEMSMRGDIGRICDQLKEGADKCGEELDYACAEAKKRSEEICGMARGERKETCPQFVPPHEELIQKCKMQGGEIRAEIGPDGCPLPPRCVLEGVTKPVEAFKKIPITGKAVAIPGTTIACPEFLPPSPESIRDCQSKGGAIVAISDEKGCLIGMKCETRGFGPMPPPGMPAPGMPPTEMRPEVPPGFIPMLMEKERVDFCKSKEECERYCELRMDECMHWLDSWLRENGGPGDCRSLDECQIFCSDPRNGPICERWLEGKGFMPSGYAPPGGYKPYAPPPVEYGYGPPEDICEHAKHEEEFICNELPKQCEEIKERAKLCDPALLKPEILAENVSQRVVDELCKLKGYKPTIEPVGDILPILIATDSKLTSEQIEKIKDLLVEFDEAPMYMANVYIYHGLVKSYNLGDVRKLDWVRDVEVDHVTLATRGPEIGREIPKPIAVAAPAHVERLEALKELDKIPSSLEHYVTENELEILEIGESIKNETDKGLLYAIRWFLGLAVDEEKNTAKFMREKAESLKSVATSLNLIAESITNLDAKTTLLKQVEELKSQANTLEGEAKAKDFNAGGILALLAGLFGGR